MDLRKGLRRLLLRGGVLIAAVVALSVIVNLSWFDEPLNPELERLKTPNPVSMEDNAYPLAYGFPAADDRDPRAAGLAIVEALRERYRDGRRPTLTDDEMAQILGRATEDVAWRANFSSLSCNSRFSLDCADRLIAEVARAGTNEPRLRVLLDRYEQILGTRRFEENQEFDASTPVPAYGALLPVARIRLAASYGRDPTPLFLSKVAEDVAFWKKMLRDGQTLIAKMVALAGLRNDMAFVSTLMRQRNLDEPDVEALRQFVRPLTTEERDIGDAFRFEMRIAVVSAKSMVGLPVRLVWQENATLNEYFNSIMLPMQLRAALSPEEFYGRQGYQRLSYGIRVFPPPLYNLGGKLVLKHMIPPDLPDYISRVHDLDGRIRLVLLQAEIARSPVRDVQAIVNASSYRNPYTGNPMRYDAAARTIGFDCLERSSNELCAVVVR